MAQELQIM